MNVLPLEIWAIATLKNPSFGMLEASTEIKKFSLNDIELEIGAGTF